MAKNTYGEDGFPENMGDDKAAFNMGLATLKTLRELMDEAHRASIADDNIKYYKILQRVYMEISSKFKGKKEKPMSEEIRQCLNILSKTYPVIISAYNKDRAYYEMLNQFHNGLIKFELWLRIQIEDFGMGMPSKDDPEFLVY